MKNYQDIIDFTKAQSELVGNLSSDSVRTRLKAERELTKVVAGEIGNTEDLDFLVPNKQNGTIDAHAYSYSSHDIAQIAVNQIKKQS